MIRSEFSLRALRPADGPALTRLITEFDGDLTTRFEVDAYEAIVSGMEFSTTGVVVENEGYDGLVGMGTVRFGRMQFNDRVLPFAFLDGLKVRPEFRGQGLGSQIAQWRIQQAREAYGDDCVICTDMLYDNYASHAVAAKWCREFLESAIHVLNIPTRRDPPKPAAGWTVCEIEASKFEEFARKQNSFYRNYNLYSPTDASSIVRAVGISVSGQKPYRYFAVEDRHGNLLAGAQTWARGLLKSDTINDPPASMRLMNRILHILPPDFTVRDISINGIWYEPGQLQAGKFLWESIRWECRDQGTTITAEFDPRDPTQAVAALKPWHQPRPQITLAIHGPSPIDRDRLIYTQGRI